MNPFFGRARQEPERISAGSEQEPQGVLAGIPAPTVRRPTSKEIRKTPELSKKSGGWKNVEKAPQYPSALFVFKSKKCLLMGNFLDKL